LFESGRLGRRGPAPLHLELAVEGLVQAGVDVLGEFYGFGGAEDFYCSSGLVDDDGAAFAVVEMDLDFLPDRGVYFAVDVVGDLEKYGVAVQLGFLSRM
jgi:hypothetical protein